MVLLRISQYSHENTYVGSLFSKVAGLKTCNFIEKRLQHRCLPVNIVKLLRAPILKNICKWLLLLFSTFYLPTGFTKYCSHNIW